MTERAKACQRVCSPCAYPCRCRTCSDRLSNTDCVQAGCDYDGTVFACKRKGTATPCASYFSATLCATASDRCAYDTGLDLCYDKSVQHRSQIRLALRLHRGIAVVARPLVHYAIFPAHCAISPVLQGCLVKHSPAEQPAPAQAAASTTRERACVVLLVSTRLARGTPAKQPARQVRSLLQWHTAGLLRSSTPLPILCLSYAYPLPILCLSYAYPLPILCLSFAYPIH